VQALLQRAGTPYVAGRFMLVRHPMDEACRLTVDEYRSLLAQPESFVDVPLDQLAAQWEPLVEDMAERVWLARFTARYVNLQGSERLHRGIPEVARRPARAIREGHVRSLEMIENLA